MALEHVLVRFHPDDPHPTRVPLVETIPLSELCLTLEGEKTNKVEGTSADACYMFRCLVDPHFRKLACIQEAEWWVHEALPFARRLGWNPYTLNWITPGCDLKD